MDTLHLTAEEIKLKVVKLLQTVYALEKRCEILQNENLALKNDLESQKNSIKALVETNKMLNIAEILHQQDEKRELKKLVTAYINEIDECIRLLSNK